jgi:hypothetical protein
VTRWRHAAIAVPFFSWKDAVAVLKRMARAAAKVVARWSLMALSVPWLGWQV